MHILILFIYGCKLDYPKTQWLIIIITIYLFAHDSAVWAAVGGDGCLYSICYLLQLVYLSFFSCMPSQLGWLE